MCEKYNGWTNYETWNFNLWFDNYFENDAEYFHIQAVIDYNDRPDQIVSNAVYSLAEYMKEQAPELIMGFDSDHPEGILGDILGHFISMVNFYEIADHYISDFVVAVEP